jgi:hypothetical protein
MFRLEKVGMKNTLEGRKEEYRTSEHGRLIAGGARHAPTTQAAPAPGPKMSAANLEAGLRQANRLGPDTQLRCREGRDWDYECSYLPTALPSPQRLHFGVNVDAERWVKVSPVVPVGTVLPRP